MKLSDHGEETKTTQGTSVLSALVESIAGAVSVFGAEIKPRLSAPGAEPEDQLRSPLETLLKSVAETLGVKLVLAGEASLSDIKVRPDYVVYVNGAISGYVEVKAPGKGAAPDLWSAKSHDGQQWEKLKALPNVLYTDGENWGLYRTGEREGEVIHLKGDIRQAGTHLAPDGDGLARLLSDFFYWAPNSPRTINQMVRGVAPLTRLLRDEVIDTLVIERKAQGGPFTSLGEDWRILLFPEADDSQFADGYAQSVTFALLLARTEGVEFAGKTIDQIAKELGRTHSLLGKALAMLTDETIGAFATTLDTLVRVISVVDFRRFAHHVADPYLALYEHFLAEYDPELRKETGSYYTPTAVVSAMTRLTDDVLRTRLGRDQGFASPDVTIVDPAMGTGTYVLDVLETVASTIAAAEGEGAVEAHLRETAARLVGIEIQTGPYAVAELRITEAFHRHGARLPKDGVRLYVADTLDDPFAEETHLAATMEPIAISRRRANHMKAYEPVVVVIGNPPYRERAKGDGGFVEDGAPGTPWAVPPLVAFREPGNGRAEYVLSNLYVYFWRWATWKVFDAHDDQSDGVVCFITTSGYLKGPGFAGMRRYLRERVSEGWIIDCTPEGHQPDVATRIFGGVQQPIAIGLFVRRRGKDPKVPGTMRYRALHGRQSAKFDELSSMRLDKGWEECSTNWTAPLLPEGGDDWSSSPALGDLMPWQVPGVKPNRTWVYAPLPETLKARWIRLISADVASKSALFVENRDATLRKLKPGLQGFPHAAISIANEAGPPLEPIPVAFRSFDIQYLIPDDRLLSTPRPDLWRVRGDQQIFVTEQHDQLVQSGPGLTFAALIPDMHHANGRGGRVLPLYASSDISTQNVAPGLLDLLSKNFGEKVSSEDLLAYVAAVTSHSGFTLRFHEDLRTPGIRVPITVNRELWDSATDLGRRVLWLHTRGERYVDSSKGRPIGPPLLENPDHRPKVVRAIPNVPGGYPNELTYDEEAETLSIGEGGIAPVSQAVVDYEVNGMNVLRKWFGYRRATRPQARGDQSPLDDVRPDVWPSAYTTDLLELLNVLAMVTELEATQDELLEQVMRGGRITVNELNKAGVFPVPDAAREPLPKLSRKMTDQTARLPL